MSKKSDERETPQFLFDNLNKEFNFTLDVCATPENAKCNCFLTKETDALSLSWAGERCFMNPPYSDLYSWVEYASSQVRLDCPLVVAILPCDTSTRWFHHFIWDDILHQTRPGVELRFPKGRFKFGKYQTSPKFATIISIFRPLK